VEVAGISTVIVGAANARDLTLIAFTKLLAAKIGLLLLLAATIELATVTLELLAISTAEMLAAELTTTTDEAGATRLSLTTDSALLLAVAKLLLDDTIATELTTLPTLLTAADTTEFAEATTLLLLILASDTVDDATLVASLEAAELVCATIATDVAASEARLSAFAPCAGAANTVTAAAPRTTVATF